MSVESLKRDARRHEQREEWVKALDLYLQAIERQEMEDEPDIALHNRVGDLQVRVGDLEGAMANYERAIDLYVAAELPNNAIAVCRKMIRHEPERPNPYLKMGQIRAAQGFAVDARQNFITYAEMMQARGESDEALRSLHEFVGLAPEDVETRVFLAELVGSRGRQEEALTYLVDAYQVAQASGLSEAQSILVRIREIDPDHAVPSVDRESVARDVEDARMDEAFEGFALASDETDGRVPDHSPEPDRDGDTLVFESGPADDLALESDSSSAGSGSTTEEEVDESEEPRLATPSGVEDSWLLGDDDAEEAEEDAGWDVPIAWEGTGDDGEAAVDADLVFEVGPGEMAEEPAGDLGPSGVGEEDAEPSGLEAMGEEAEAAAIFDAAAGIEDAFDVTRLEEEGTEGEGTGEEAELPYLSFDPESFGEGEGEGGIEGESGIEGDGAAVDVPVSEPRFDSVSDEPSVESHPADPIPALREHLGGSPDDAAAWRKLGDALFKAGDPDGGREALETAHRLYAEQGEPEKGVRVIRELLIQEPHRIELRQRAVEYAHQSNERTLLVEAFVELADGLRAAGETEKASAVLRQVLEIDPGNLRANEGVAALSTDPSSAAAPSAAAEAPHDYVDLGAMVLDEEVERTTRWTVPAEEPSGDEAADFARMLSQFKDKVAENISSDDAQSHYDLGSAYKDMGLMQEAIGEFQQALRAQPNHLATFEMLGECFLEMGDADVAIRTLERGLTLPTEVEDDLLGIYYWLAKANEGVGKAETAREYYERIFSLDINFKDVVERLKGLR